MADLSVLPPSVAAGGALITSTAQNVQGQLLGLAAQIAALSNAGTWGGDEAGKAFEGSYMSPYQNVTKGATSTMTALLQIGPGLGTVADSYQGTDDTNSADLQGSYNP